MKRKFFFNDFFGGGELFLVNLDVTGSHTYMQIHKNNITNQKRKKSTKPILR